MLIHISASIQQMIIKMADELEVPTVSVVPGVEKMNIDILSDNYDKKSTYHTLVFSHCCDDHKYHLK